MKQGNIASRFALQNSNFGWMRDLLVSRFKAENVPWPVMEILSTFAGAITHEIASQYGRRV
jgi:hypothetical protein